LPSKQPVDVGGQKKRVLDTVLCRYVFENNGTTPYTIGLRTQVDTLIGENDGVPFTVPGYTGMVGNTAFANFAAPVNTIPPFLQALEVPNLKAPGTVALVTVKVGGKVEAPNRVSLTNWENDGGV